MSKPAVLIIGPVGCGKTRHRNRIDQYGVSLSNFIEIDQYNTSRGYYRIFQSMHAMRGLVAIENGGGLFVNSEFMSQITVRAVVAPHALIAFSGGFKLPESKLNISLPKFEPFFDKFWKLCIDDDHPCAQQWADLKREFINQGIATCYQRVKRGQYMLNYTGSKRNGHFKDEQTMEQIMTQVIERNFRYQLWILLWARATRTPIHTLPN